MYREWVSDLAPVADVYPVQYPGHGDRISETPIDNWKDMVRSLVEVLSEYQDKPYAFFGYSMGALIAFELARSLKECGMNEPTALWLGARRAPDSLVEGRIIHDLENREFLEELKRFGGMTEQILTERGLLELLMPVLRADFKICETYEYKDGEVLETPINVFGGEDDSDAPQVSLAGWKRQTTGDFSMRIFSGGHFFINDQKAMITDEIAASLNGSLGLV